MNEFLYLAQCVWTLVHALGFLRKSFKGRLTALNHLGIDVQTGALNETVHRCKAKRPQKTQRGF